MWVIRTIQEPLFYFLDLIQKKLPQYFKEENTFSKEVRLMSFSQKAKSQHLYHYGQVYMEQKTHLLKTVLK